MNVSDSERVSTTLARDGFEMTQDESAADVVIFNTCSVRERAEHKLYTRVGEVRHSHAKKPVVGIMGCVWLNQRARRYSKRSAASILCSAPVPSAVCRMPLMKHSPAKGGYLDVGEREG